MPKELEPPEQPEDQEGLEPSTAWDEVAYSLAQLIGRKEVREAVKKWVEAQADNIPKDHSYRIQQLWAGWGFSVIVLGSIVALGVYKIISPEVMVGLLGPLLGYWFGKKSAQ